MTSLVTLEKDNHPDHIHNSIKKSLVSMSIEKVLLDIGNETYDKVIRVLYQKHHSNFQDCYKHPEYLSETLAQLYGNASKVIINQIKKQLEEFSYNESIAKFLKAFGK